MIQQNKKLSLIFVAVFGLIGIAVFFSLSVKQEKQAEADLFQKKQECASYRDVIEKELEARPLSVSLDQIFYSPSRSSCLYSYQSYTLRSYYIADYLTNENIFGSGGIKDEVERERTWREQIKELKE